MIYIKLPASKYDVLNICLSVLVSPVRKQRLGFPCGSIHTAQCSSHRRVGFY